ncbi:MAG: extracellular solute-binding protein [Rhizonema sp. PD37]|nr:extracellular solute-binding protein [Rhizonema sp. PD37]
MERRSFLLGAGTVALSQLFISCADNNQATLYVQLLKDSIPGQVVNQFGQVVHKTQLNFAPVAQLQDLFKQLQTWQKKTNTTDDKDWRRFIPLAKSKKTTKADLVTLGDYWISVAIKQNLIQPLEVSKLKQWSSLPQRWQELGRRNDQGQVDPQGKVWAVPYRWGSTVIVYRRDKFLQEFNWTPSDWGDLWRKELRDRISLLDQPREVVGLVLKKLGKSYNTKNLDIPNLEVELQNLNQQVKFYSSDRYLEPLVTGDTLLAVGWSSDILSILGHYPQLSVVIPRSGTALWADMWVRPTGKNSEDSLYKWIDFCLQPRISQQISLLTKTNSPSAQVNASDISESWQKVLLSNSEAFEKSEFLLPLPPDTAVQYESLFAKIKR